MVGTFKKIQVKRTKGEINQNCTVILSVKCKETFI